MLCRMSLAQLYYVKPEQLNSLVNEKGSLKIYAIWSAIGKSFRNIALIENCLQSR